MSMLVTYRDRKSLHLEGLLHGWPSNCTLMRGIVLHSIWLVSFVSWWKLKGSWWGLDIWRMILVLILLKSRRIGVIWHVDIIAAYTASYSTKKRFLMTSLICALLFPTTTSSVIPALEEVRSDLFLEVGHQRLVHKGPLHDGGLNLRRLQNVTVLLPLMVFLIQLTSSVCWRVGSLRQLGCVWWGLRGSDCLLVLTFMGLRRMMILLWNLIKVRKRGWYRIHSIIVQLSGSTTSFRFCVQLLLRITSLGSWQMRCSSSWRVREASLLYLISYWIIIRIGWKMVGLLRGVVTYCPSVDQQLGLNSLRLIAASCTCRTSTVTHYLRQILMLSNSLLMLSFLRWRRCLIAIPSTANYHQRFVLLAINWHRLGWDLSRLLFPLLKPLLHS